MYLAIAGFYKSAWGATINIDRASYDANGAVTTQWSLIAQTVYTISVMESISGASSNQITVKLLSTKSAVSVTLPKNLQLSAPPMKGSFRFVCANPDGTSNTTADVDMYLSSYLMAQVITASCPYYREKFLLWDGPSFPYNQDGRDLLIRFVGLN